MKEGENEQAFKLGPQTKPTSSKIIEGAWRINKNRVASRGDEKLGLSDEQKERAKKLAEEDDKQPSDFHYRAVRKKPLLMVHILALGKGEEEQTGVPSYGISFPPGNYSKSIDVVANRVWVNQIHGGTFDTPGEEDDYDE